jgi:hypothetical protein
MSFISTYLKLLNFITLRIFGEKYILWSSHYAVSPFPAPFTILRSNTLHVTEIWTINAISILMQHFCHFFLVLVILTGHDSNISISSCRPQKKISSELHNYRISTLSKQTMYVDLINNN